VKKRREARRSSGTDRVILAGGRKIVVRTTRNRHARRMTLRIDPKDGCAVLTLPTYVPLSQGLGFARSKGDWLACKLDELPPHTPFRDDAVIPFLGRNILIRHFPLAGTRPVLAGDVLHVPGPEAELADAVRGWLMEAAREQIARRVRVKARMLGREAPAIRLTDPRARWGSCSAEGRLCFSWRLVMAPEVVLDYVVAHEVAHLVALNHGRRFQATVDRLTARAAEARDWLARLGSGLLRYG
jgi:hypothetical protein